MTAEPLGAAKLEVRRSRFYAHLYRVEDSLDVSRILAGHREAAKSVGVIGAPSHTPEPAN